MTAHSKAKNVPNSALKQPLTDAVSDDDDAATPAERPDSPGDAQQRLDTVADGSGHDEATAVEGTEETGGESPDDRDQRDPQASDEQPEIREHVQQAIAALQTLEEAL